MDNAVSQLDAIMHQKTVHSATSITESMRALCGYHHLFSSPSAQQDFAQKCRNFEIVVERTGKRSWGRKEFEKWWNEDSEVEPPYCGACAGEPLHNRHSCGIEAEKPPWVQQNPRKTDYKPMRSNVVDMFTRGDHMQMGQDYATNDAAADSGKYLGVLPKHVSAPIREEMEDVARRRAQIDALMAEFTPRWEGLFFMQVGALTHLGVTPDEFNPVSQEFFVDRDGHCWLKDIKEE